MKDAVETIVRYLAENGLTKFKVELTNGMLTLTLWSIDKVVSKMMILDNIMPGEIKHIIDVMAIELKGENK